MDYFGGEKGWGRDRPNVLVPRGLVRLTFTTETVLYELMLSTIYQQDFESSRLIDRIII